MTLSVLRLSVKQLRDDTDELVIWDDNLRRPIAYINRADASREEWKELISKIEKIDR